MSRAKITHSNQLNQYQENSLEEKRFIPIKVIIDFAEVADENISHAELRLYMAILAYGQGKGHLSMSNDKLIKDFPIFSDKQLKDHARALEKKGKLFRDRHPLHKKGTMKYWVPEPYHHLFIQYIIKTHKNYAMAARCQVYFNGGDVGIAEEYFKSVYGSVSKKPSKVGKTYLKSKGRINHPSIINYVNKDSKKDEAGAAASLKWQDIEKEIVKSKQNVHKGKELFESEPEHWLTRDNPVAAIIAALKGGYSDDRIKKARDKRDAERRGKEAEREKAKCCEVGGTISHIAQGQSEKFEVVDIHPTVCHIKVIGENGFRRFDFDSKGIESLKKFLGDHKVTLPKEIL